MGRPKGSKNRKDTKTLTAQQQSDLEWTGRHRQLYETTSLWIGGLLLLITNIAWSYGFNITVLPTFTASTSAWAGFFFEIGILLPLFLVDFYIVSKQNSDAAAVAAVAAAVAAAVVAAVAAEAVVAMAVVAVAVAVAVVTFSDGGHSD
jgi:hypothetical protein